MSDDDMRFGAPPPTGPEWAPYMDAEAYQAFRVAVVDDLGKRGFQARVDEGVVEVRRGDQVSRCGLQNLSQVCAQNPRSDWPILVRDHFDQVLKVMDGAMVPEDFGEDFAAVQDLLRPRLMAPRTLGQASLDCVSRPLAEDLDVVLVFDLPETTMTVKPDFLEIWGRDADELLAIATANLAASEDLAPDVERFDFEGGGHLDIYGDGYYAASHLLFLERYLDPAPPAGALVSVPHRHALLVHPIRDMQVVPTLNALIPVAAGMFEEGPGSISPHLYWWRPQGLTLLETAIEDDSLVFRPPEDFVAVLNSLAERTDKVS